MGLRTDFVVREVPFADNYFDKGAQTPTASQVKSLSLMSLDKGVPGKIVHFAVNGVAVGVPLVPTSVPAPTSQNVINSVSRTHSIYVPCATLFLAVVIMMAF